MRYNVRFYFLLMAVMLAGGMQAGVQKKVSSYEKYIKEYSSLAVEHQKKHKIPASITLAQALLESGAGQSDLARKSNNHFGIKCHSDWKGGRVYQADDKPNDCFRKYPSVKASYEDHSLFLKRSRYESLFKLKITDYKGWAKGLQKCGYATDKAYANRLIKLIEDYELYRFDTEKGQKASKQEKAASKQEKVVTRTIYKSHGLFYVLAGENDNLEAIAGGTGSKLKDLLKYNEIPEDFPLQRGDIVYMEKKKKKADKPNYDHVVQVGESMYSISQRYGLQLKSLYKLNKKKDDYIPEEGDVLKLR